MESSLARLAAVPDTADETTPAARWGRAGMGAYFVVTGTASLAASATDVAQVLLGTPTPMQWLTAGAVLFQVLSGFVFAAGMATAWIARSWILFLLARAFALHAFWSVPPEMVATSASLFAADLGVAASLWLFLDRWQRR